MPNPKNLLRLIVDQRYRKVSLARLAMRRLKNGFPNVDAVTIKSDECRLVLPVDDRVISPQHVAFGMQDKAEFDQVLKIAADHNHPIQGVVLEIGGNIGTTTVAIGIQPAVTKVYSFEPEPSNFDYLNVNVSINHLGHKVQTICSAVGAEETSLNLELNQRQRGGHRITGAVEPGESSVAVQCTSIDDFLQKNNVTEDVGFIWIDVEGYEGFVLKGAEQLLAKRNAGVVVELWPHGMSQSGSLEPFREMTAKYFSSFIDLSTMEKHAVKDLSKTLANYPGNKDYTNLLLLNDK